MKVIYLIFLCLLVNSIAIAQNNNGTIDDIIELSTKQTIPIRMPGGVHLMTDVYLPITSDSLTVVNVIGADTLTIELIPKGTQLVIYPTMIDNNGDTVANPNPYQLPLVFSRSPYNKALDEAPGVIFSFFGYAYAVQDMRGRYDSEGVYLPMYSDGWQKYPYYSHNHALDITNSTDSANGRFHEDGWMSYQFLLNDFKKDFDLNNDGLVDTTAHVCNGSFGMFGASALGNSQYQLASAHRIDTSLKGLRCIMPIVATNEHYNTTAYNNGVYRTMISTGWITGQLSDIQDTVGTDNDIQNAVHSPFDFGFINEADFTGFQPGGTTLASSYPNSITRVEMDASYATVDAAGEGNLAANISRYKNMDVAGYHLTGWYDIFINGQIKTWNSIRDNISGSNQQLQKLVIGPWAHQTICSKTTGDLTYPDNVKDVLDLPVDNIDINNLDVNAIVNSELMAWYRYNLNQNGYVHLGEPMIRIPESHVWQSSAGILFRIPASDYDITLIEMANFLGGMSGLPLMPAEIDLGGTTTIFNIDVPLLDGNPPFTLADTIQAPEPVDFKDSVPDVRFYVIGPVDTLSLNQGVGNYWYNANEFPLTGPEIQFTPFYLHQNGDLDQDIPTFHEGVLTYAHDPDDPVFTVGGANMIVRTPQNDRNSQGQMNYADTNFVNYTMNHTGVIQFQTATFMDTLSIIGFPKATIYAKSEPQGVGTGETDTDFFIRVLDVYPDGREFNVVEGAVNARAREYARSIYNGNENDTAVFSNINIGQIYEFQFEMLPIAYTFGRHHSMKVLISSGNFPRYQSNPNIPIEDGEFFRRNPNDGQTYNYQNQTYSPRVSDNSIVFSDSFPSRIELPVYNGSIYTGIEVSDTYESFNDFELEVFPNPTSDILRLKTLYESEYKLVLYDATGKEVYRCQYQGNSYFLNLKMMTAGVYTLNLYDEHGGLSTIRQVIKK